MRDGENDAQRLGATSPRTLQRRGNGNVLEGKVKYSTRKTPYVSPDFYSGWPKHDRRASIDSL